MESPYAPLNVLKPVAPEVWVVDGPHVHFYGLPFSTRMTVIRLAGGDLFLHSPTEPEPSLVATVAALGRVRHLVSPNWIHYSHIPAWARQFPDALAWSSPGVEARAAARKVQVVFHRHLGPEAPADWAGEIDQMIVEGGSAHREVVFFHRASKVLILTDLIENFEATALPFWFGPIAALAGVLAPNGQMPIDMWFTFRKGRGDLRTAVQRMLDWAPEQLILAHGRWYSANGTGELRRGFRRVLVGKPTT